MAWFLVENAATSDPVLPKRAGHESRFRGSNSKFANGPWRIKAWRQKWFGAYSADRVAVLLRGYCFFYHLSCGTPAHTQTLPDSTVSLAWSITELAVNIGDSFKKVNTSYVLEEKPTQLPAVKIYRFEPKDLDFVFSDNNCLAAIRMGPRFTGAMRGVGLNSTQEELIARFGPPTRSPVKSGVAKDGGWDGSTSYIYSLDKSINIRFELSKIAKIARMELLPKSFREISARTCRDAES